MSPTTKVLITNSLLGRPKWAPESPLLLKWLSKEKSKSYDDARHVIGSDCRQSPYGFTADIDSGFCHGSLLSAIHLGPRSLSRGRSHGCARRPRRSKL